MIIGSAVGTLTWRSEDCGNVLTLFVIRTGKTIREWSAADLPHGEFERMAREIDPFGGVYADAGAPKRKYRVTRESFDGGYRIVELEAFNENHAMAIAWDERGWSPGLMHAILIDAEENT